MPGITAEYGGTTVVGYNAWDRIIKEMPSVKIKQHANKLADFMDKLDKEKGRSPYACAEAQALALLLGAIGGNVDFSKIVFGVPNSDNGHVLWEPCGNCHEWLEHKGGWGPDRTYGLNKVALGLVAGAPSSSVLIPKFSDSDFPPL